MKIRNLLLVIAFGGVALSVSAQEVAENKAQLQEIAKSPEVQEELINDPDGCEIQIAGDGSYQLFARGTGVYDFNDPDDVKDAKKEALLRAKANLAKFLKEKISTEEGLDEASKKVKSLTTDGQNESKSVSKESVKVTLESIRNSSEAILTGVITLYEIKQPRGNGGEVQVTVGLSSKTLKAAQQIGKGINESLTNREADGRGIGGGAAPVQQQPNKGYIRRSNSAF